MGGSLEEGVPARRVEEEVTMMEEAAGEAGDPSQEGEAEEVKTF